MSRDEVFASLAGWPEIGRSVEDRRIFARGFPGGPEAVLLFGAIHGEEPLGVACLLRLAEELAGRTGPLPRATWIIPVVNPDGYRLDRRHNAHGVDLNRNFPAANWTRTCRPGYEPGEAPASEPETRVLMDLIERTGARRLIALHSPLRTVNYDGPARALAERMAAKNGYGASADIGYPTPGSFGSYYAIDKGYEVVTLEIPPLEEAQAWHENRAALYEALDIECDSLSHSGT